MSVKVSYKSNHGIQGSYDVPLDKSIAQRSAILGLSTNAGVEGEDIVSTKKAAKQIRSGEDNPCLDMGNSGTGMRLMAGFIAGLGIDAELVGDESLSNRPMERIAKPLREMGAEIHLKEGKPPIKITKSNMADEFIYDLEIPSAQIKSCLLLAALSAGTKIKIIEKETTRNHTELLLQHLDADLLVKKSDEETEIIPTEVDEIGDLSEPGPVDEVANSPGDDEQQSEACVEIKGLTITDQVVYHSDDCNQGDAHQQGNADRIFKIRKKTETDTTVLNMSQIQKIGNQGGHFIEGDGFPDPDLGKLIQGQKHKHSYKSLEHSGKAIHQSS